ncbi:MAG: type I-B CRISPR-associated protein Cas5b [Clostridiales bacterium]|nr:type I-B CRISPR-associated protein Cas5b [Clostridiales bacterium]MCF8023306.1 type I-B CRISPR-associated protein Cas5b [Clostridiales bacterium]
MKALRIKVFQDTACYKKPLSFKVGETYPLPPFSTVKGMLHAVMDANEYIPMNISIQGGYEYSFLEYQSHYFYKFRNREVNRVTKEIKKGKKGREEIPGEAPLTTKEKPCNDPVDYKDLMVRSPIYKYSLKNVNLIIHVMAEDNILKKLETAFEERSFLSLGAAEYLIRIDEIKETNLYLLQEDIITKYNFYVRHEQAEEINLKYVPYSLCWKYQVINGTREWEKIHAGYVKKGQLLCEVDDVLIDEEKNPVFFCLPIK